MSHWKKNPQRLHNKADRESTGEAQDCEDSMLKGEGAKTKSIGMRSLTRKTSASGPLSFHPLEDKPEAMTGWLPLLLQLAFHLVVLCVMLSFFIP